MRKDSIRKHIDNKILKDFYLKKTPYEIREDLMSSCVKYEKSISTKVDIIKINEIENITDVRSRYLSLYVYLAKKRIIDLYKVESKYLYGWDYAKKFKAILFKEKLELNSTPF
jgi:hypothetical protein